MADNYLERRMEDLRSGRLAADTARLHSKAPARNPRRLSITFPEMRVLVADGLSDTGKAIVKAFRSVGMKVAFCAPSSAEGNLFAQQSGARFCPTQHGTETPEDYDDFREALAGLEKAWGGIDLIVWEHEGTEKAARIEANAGFPPTLALNPARFPGGTPPESIARIALILAHPDFGPFLESL